MKILFLTDNYPPESNAPAIRTHYHCREWVRLGADVTVVTGAPNFPRGRVFEGYENRLHQTEVLDGVRVVRVWTYMAPNAGFLRRTCDFVSFAIGAVAAGLVEDFDVVVATSPQFFTAVAGRTLAALKRRPWVFELRDLWPESIVATGAMRDGFAIAGLERLELDLYRAADLIVPVTQSFRSHLISRGIRGDKVHVIPNGVDEAEVVSDDSVDEAGIRSADDVLKVGYIGTHGMAHGLDIVFRVAPLLDGYPVEFVLVGDGAEKPRLEHEAKRLVLSNVRLLPPVGRSDVPSVLANLDVSLVPLRNVPTFRNVIPSKIFEAAAARRPVLLGVLGEAAGIVEGYGSGLVFEPENEVALAESILRLIQDPGLYRRLQEGAGALAADYSRRRLAGEMLAALAGLTPNGSVGPRGTIG